MVMSVIGVRAEITVLYQDQIVRDGDVLMISDEDFVDQSMPEYGLYMQSAGLDMEVISDSALSLHAETSDPKGNWYQICPAGNCVPWITQDDSYVVNWSSDKNQWGFMVHLTFQEKTLPALSIEVKIRITDEDGNTLNFSILSKTGGTPVLSLSTGNNKTMWLGDQMQLEIYDTRGDNQTPLSDEFEIEWSSSDSSIVSIDDNGFLICHNAGDAVVTASLKSRPEVTTTSNIHVEKPELVISQVDNEVNTLYVGSQISLRAECTNNPDWAGLKDLYWECVTPEIAQVTQDGVATTLKVGEAIIEVYSTVYDDVRASLNIYVEPPVITEITAKQSEYKLYVDETLADIVECAGIDGWEYYDSLMFTSSNSRVAKVDKSGIITGIAPGYVDIIVCSNLNNQVKASIGVVVEEPTFKVYSKEQDVFRNTRYWIPINLKNMEDVLGFQCDVELGDGIEFDKASSGNCNPVVNASRSSSHTIVTNDIETNSIRLIMSSPANEIIYPEDAALLYVPVLISENAIESVEISLKGIVISTSESSSNKLKDYTYRVFIKDLLPGDLDGDGEINVADVTGTISVILNQSHYNLTEEGGDFNGDGNIDIQDVVSIIDHILTVPRKVSGNVGRNPNYASMYSDIFTIDPAEFDKDAINNFNLNLSEASSYIAAQFDIVLPEHVQFVENDSEPAINLRGEIAKSHSLSTSMIDDNTCRVLIYSLGNTPFADDVLLNMNLYVEGDMSEDALITLNDVKLIDVKRESIDKESEIIRLVDKSGSMVNSVSSELIIVTRNHQISIYGIDDNSPVCLYSLDGILLQMKNNSENQCEFEVSPGIYIVRVGFITHKINVR